MKHSTPREFAALFALSIAACLSLWGSQALADTKTRTSSFEYDDSWLLKKEVVEPDSPNDCLQTTYTYDNGNLNGNGNRTGVSTAACPGASGYTISSAATARTASTTFSADGRFALSSTNALAQSETRQYDARFGAVTSLTGPNGLTTQWLYDGFGRKVKETRSDGTHTTWAYKLCTEAGADCPYSFNWQCPVLPLSPPRNKNDPITLEKTTANPCVEAIHVVIEQSYAANATPSAPQKRAYYDPLGRVIRSQTQGFDGAGAAPTLVQDTEYNYLGQLTRKSNAYALAGGTPSWASYSYDVLGRVIREDTPDPAATATAGIASTTQSYNGLVTTVTNSNNQTKTTTKNAQGQVAQITDALGATVNYRYDALGQLTQTNAAGSITTLTYNQRGQKVSMVDPAMGAWEYRYNAFGELVWQRDSLNQVVSMVYDNLGRLTQRTEPDLLSKWSYDKKFDGTACGKGIGKLCEATAANGYKRMHTYDSLGRPSATSTVLDNPAAPAVVSVAYDAVTGRLASKTWPTGYQASYQYTASGYLKKVNGGGTNGFTQAVAYEVLAVDAQGHITQYKQGSQITTVRVYEPATGRLKSQSATQAGQSLGNVLNQSYGYDPLGNLLSRADNTPGVGTQESFSYDSLNRLTLSILLGGAISPPKNTEVLYDARGNIAYKSDVGRYWYDGDRPNRMTNVTLATAPGATEALTGTRVLAYAFDDARPGAQNVNGVALGNGNLEYTVTHDTANNRHTVRGESYTSFNMPNQITFGNFITNTTSTNDRTLAFVYGPEHQRIKQTITLTGNGTSSYFAGNVWYLNGEDSQGLGYEKEIRANGTTEHKHYVSAGGVTFALFTSRTGTLNGLPATSTSYLHHDHLGSVAAITNETGAVVERLAFDPWGKRRYTNGNVDTLDAIVGQKTDRGYTMHEHLDEIGAIHMNGRIFDPLIGRFMSADPFIQAPGNLQSYNRYSYVINNPLAYTDPSGYFWNPFKPPSPPHQALMRIGDQITATVTAYSFFGIGVNNTYNRTFNYLQGSGGYQIKSAALGFVSLFCGPGAWGCYAGFQAGLAKGYGASDSETHRVAAVAAVSSGAFQLAGGVGDSNSYARYAAHAGAGCISSVAGGGNCGRGAVSAVFGKYASNGTAGFGGDGVQGTIAQGVAAVVAGGVSSVIAGGKFANGAETAAYGYLFNQLLTGRAGVGAGAGAGAGASQLTDSLSVKGSERLYVTYTLTDDAGREYFGRTSGYGTPDEIVQTRFAYHHAQLDGFKNPQVDRAAYGDDGYVQIRGREQLLIDSRGGVHSPNVGNAINGISVFNPRRSLYIDSAVQAWGIPHK